MRTSAAYDLSRFAPEPQRQPQVKVVKTTKKKTNSKRALKVRCVVFAVVLMLLMTATVFSRLQLTETRTMINALTSDLIELESENTYLNYELESSVPLKYAEDYAVNELGLVKLNSNQIEYVSLNGENSIVVHGEQEGFLDKLVRFFNNVVEFFGGQPQ